MSNLGRYQDIVTDAKRAGGVDALIQIIEDTAVARKRPTLVGLGFGAGVLLASLVGGGAVAVRHRIGMKAEQEAVAEEAKRQLRAEVHEQEIATGANGDIAAEAGDPVDGGEHE